MSPFYSEGSYETRKLYCIVCNCFPDIAIMALGWKPIHFALAGMMLVFGSFNTLSVKWADTMTSESLDGTQKKFNHPFVQAIGKYIGSTRSSEWIPD